MLEEGVGRLSRVVCARLSGSAGREGLVGVRWEVDRSRLDDRLLGGEGAARRAVGTGLDVNSTDDFLFGG